MTEASVARLDCAERGAGSAECAQYGRAESAGLENRDIVVVMAGQMNGNGNDDFGDPVGSAAVEAAALREGRRPALTIDACRVEWSG